MDKLSREMLECQTSLGLLQISPDGKYAAWVETRPGVEEDKYQYWLAAADLSQNRVFPLTGGGGEGSFCWLDGASVVFPAMRTPADQKSAADGEPLTVFYKISVTGGEARELFRIPLKGASALAAVGESLLIAANCDGSLPDYASLDDEGKREYRKTVASRKQFLVGEERRYRFDGMGYVNKVRRRLYLYHLPTGELKPITGAEQNIGEYALSADAKTLVYCAGVDKLNGECASSAVFVYDFASCETKAVLPDSDYQIGRVALFGGKVYFWGTKLENAARCKLEWLSVSLKDGSIEQLPQGDFTVTSSYGSDAVRMQGFTVRVTEDAMYLLRYKRRVSQIYRYTGEGEPQPVSDSALKVNFFDVRAGAMLACGFDKLGLLEVFSIKDGAHTKLTDYTSTLTYTPAPPQSMMFTNSDGVEIDGWLVRPLDSKPGEKLPAILMIHGGPHGEYSDILLHDLQYIVAKGYAVMYCNPRGSTGRGSAFGDLVGKYGTIDFKDVTEFVDNVLAKCPDIDANRLGVTGASYGGYMTNWIITHDHRFKAAASQCCVANWFTMYYVCDIPFFVRGEMGGTPTEIPDEYRRASPLSYVSDIRTPTLFLQYDADYRCPIDQGISMYNGMVMNGVDARIAFFAGDNHTITSTGKPSSRIRRHEELIGWFDKYLK